MSQAAGDDPLNERRKWLAASNREPQTEALGLGIVSVTHLAKGIGFLANAFDEGIVFLGVVTHSFKFIPEALDRGQALTGFL